ncbi:phosphatidylglycerol phospholipase C [[Candida] anglica]|uniref:Phosphatidylglycerol phospholipase C n=1 Tax=[Candida] anglica TaxID=148631 RepID=A0ABP0EDN0_9ASCO
MSVISPVVAGHRGFKADYPENTFEGFEKCFDAGAPLIETDLWLSTDEEIIISHDANTKRLFETEDGQPTDLNILYSSYEKDLKNLKRIGSNEKLATLKDVLHWFVGYIENHQSSELVYRIMFDIKRQNPPKLLNNVVKHMLEVKDDIEFWNKRIQFGVWDLKMVKYLNQEQYFKDVYTKYGEHMDIFHISVSWQESLQYLEYNKFLDLQKTRDGLFKFKVTGISFLYISTWSKDFITHFLPLMRAQNLKLYSWTINTQAQFDFLWSMGKLYKFREYGIISDHPNTMADYVKSKQPNEVSKLMNDPQKLQLSKFQKISSFAFWVFSKIATKKKSADETQFDTLVDRDFISTPRASKLGSFIFSICQKFGIF